MAGHGAHQRAVLAFGAQIEVEIDFRLDRHRTQHHVAQRFDDRLREQAPIAKVLQHVDTDQTFRYSPASGDPMPIHLDADVARSAGLPGIIAHGLCTMAFTSWAVLTEVAGSDVRRLKRLAVRFSKMVLPGDDLETRIWQAGSTADTTSYAFETARVGTDEFAITDGLAVIAD